MKNLFQIFLTVFSITFSLVGLSTTVWGAPGDLDPTFGGDGWVTTQPPGSNGSIANAVLLQQDQKIVAGGITATLGVNDDFCLTRYLPDGSLDPSFGNAGIVVTDFPGNDGNRPADFILDLALQPDGKIVAGGGTVLGTNLPISQTPPTAGDLNFALARYLPNGALDPTFGNGGLLSFDFSGINAIDQIDALAIQPDGRIVAAGHVSIARGSSNHDMAVVRLNPDGTLDPSFGNGGMVRINFSNGSDDSAHDLSLLPDGKILVAGSTQPVSIAATDDFALARLNPDGSLDNTFGNGGLVTTNFVQNTTRSGIESDDTAYGLAIQPDGRIVLTGSALERNPLTSRIALARYLSDGALDPSFGDQGRVLTDFSDLLPGTFVEARELAFTPYGKIVVAGNVGALMTPPLNSDFALARYLPDGSLDTTFGRGGKVIANFTEQERGLDGANDIALQPDGKAVAVGYVQLGVIGNANLLAFGVARFDGDRREEATPPPAVENPADPRATTPQTAATGIQFVIEGSGCALGLGRTPSPFGFWMGWVFSFGILFGLERRRRSRI